MADNHSLAPFMHKMADVAGDIAKRYWRKPVKVEHKADSSPVTLADREIESALRDLVASHYPSHGMIGEEHGSINPEATLQWVIDPIDGTRSFIAGLHTFTTLIALVENGKPIAGLISQPITGERWLGMAGETTLYNDRPASSHRVGGLARATMTTTSTYHFSDSERRVFETLRGKCANVVLGGDAYTYALLASGHGDIVADAGMKPYDFCALVPVVEGAGGIITDWEGKPLTLHSGGCVLAAANESLHREALSILQSVN